MKNYKEIILNSFLHIDLNKVLSQEIWSIKNKKNNILNLKKIYLLFKFLLQILYRSIFSSPLIRCHNSKYILYIRTNSRPDINKHSGYYENIENTSLCLFSKKIIKFDLIKFIYSIYIFFKLKKSFNKILNSYSIKLFSYSGLKLSLILFTSISDAQKIFLIMLNHQKLVSFQEMTPTENMICQLANINKIETFAHEQGVGFYKDKGHYWERFPVTTYLNSVCKNILCWGQFSKTLFKEHTSANVFIIGKAALPKIEKIEEGVTFVFQNEDCESANSELMKISNILENCKIPISRWFKQKENILIKHKIGRDGPLRKIVLGCSSNLLLELGFLGLQVLVIKDSVLANFLPKDFILDNPIKILEKSISSNYPKEYWKNFIECTGSESVNRYKFLLFNN